MTEIKITEKKESPLLSRTEVTAEVAYSGKVPKKEEFRSKLATALSAKENLLVLKKIRTKFGDKKAKISFYIYNNEKDMSDIEPKKKEKKAKTETKEEKEGKGEEK